MSNLKNGCQVSNLVKRGSVISAVVSIKVEIPVTVGYSGLGNDSVLEEIIIERAIHDLRCEVLGDE